MTGTASVRHGLCLGHGQTRVRNFFYEFPCPPPPIGFREPERETGPMPPAGLAPLPGDRDLDAATEALVGLTLAQIERRVIEATIRNCGGSLPRAAQVLGVSPSTLYRKRSAWRD